MPAPVEKLNNVNSHHRAAQVATDEERRINADPTSNGPEAILENGFRLGTPAQAKRIQLA